MTSVAIAHDYLTQRGGAERVVLAMLRAFPDATVYTTLYDPEGTYPEFKGVPIVTSPLNRWGLARRNHRLALPLLPLAARGLRPQEDVVLVSSSGWAHGFRARGVRLVYCYSPARWLYQTSTYLGGSPWASLPGWLLLALRPLLTNWDRRQARKATRYLAISRVVQERILQTYGMPSDVLPAPHSTDITEAQEVVAEVEPWTDVGFHLLVSRLLPYKNVGAATAAFAALPDQRLVVVGRGPERESLIATAPSNVLLLQDLSDAQLRWLYSRCTALIAPSIEDYGLTPLEAGAYGKPTLALRGGGYLDTVEEGRTGLFFDDPTPESIQRAVMANIGRNWDGTEIQKHVEQFGEGPFIRALHAAVAEVAKGSATATN